MLFFQTIGTKHESFGPVNEDGDCDFDFSYYEYCEDGENDPEFVAEYNKAWDMFERVCPGDATPVFIDTETEEMYIIGYTTGGRKIRFRLIKEEMPDED